MILEIISIYFYRNKRIIFDNFSLKLKKSQLMILIGKNGVGKSSLFDLISGILKPERGIIKINNIPIENLENTKRKTFLYLPHKDSLKNHLTIQENLSNWLIVSDNKICNELVNKALTYFNITELRHNYVGNLSQGQRKKVLLSKLLLSNCKFWLLDEPFNGLDADSVRKVKKLIQNNLKTGGSVILSSHTDQSFKKSKKVHILKAKKSNDGIFPKFDNWKEIL